MDSDVQLQYRIGDQNDSVTDPEAEAIREILAKMQNRDSALLMSDDSTFMQVMINGEEILLEHQDTSMEQFFEAPSDISREEMIEAFVSYANEDDAWRKQVSWSHIPPEEFSMDFTLLASLPEEALDGKSEVSFEGHLEMPYISAYHWLTLYQQACGGELDDLEDEFVLLCEAEAESDASIYMYPIPPQLAVTLENLDSKSASDLAKRWYESEDFPVDIVQAEEAATLLHEIHQMAREAAAQSEILILCELVYGDEEEE